VLILDDCDANLALQQGSQLGEAWQCANSTHLAPTADCTAFLNTCHTLLDLTAPLQLGAVPFASAHNNNNPVPPPPLDGCLRNLRIDRRFVDLNSYVVNNGTLAGCPERREFCASHPCQNGGQCREGWGGYVCRCPAGWGGKDCADKLKPARRFRAKGNGFAVFNPGLYPIQIPWMNSLSFRTKEGEGLLMLAQIRKVGWSRLQLVNGSLEYTLAGLRLRLASPRLNDGEWHHASVKWMVGEVWLNLDYGQHELTKQSSIVIQVNEKKNIIN
jgi:cadherin EGF LAG seven-pass G-type receptor 1